MIMRALLLGVCIAVGTISTAYSGYVVEGSINGSVCSNWIVLSRCHMVDIDAVEGDKGELFTVARRFETVDEFSGGMCFMRLHYDGWIAWVMRKTTGPVFLTKLPDGTYKKVDAEYIVFKCSEEK